MTDRQWLLHSIAIHKGGISTLCGEWREQASLSTPGPQLGQAGEGGQMPSGFVPSGSAQDALGAKIMWYTHTQAEDRNGAT